MNKINYVHPARPRMCIPVPPGRVAHLAKGETITLTPDARGVRWITTAHGGH